MTWQLTRDWEWCNRWDRTRRAVRQEPVIIGIQHIARPLQIKRGRIRFFGNLTSVSLGHFGIEDKISDPWATAHSSEINGVKRWWIHGQLLWSPLQFPKDWEETRKKNPESCLKWFLARENQSCKHTNTLLKMNEIRSQGYTAQEFTEEIDTDEKKV